MAEPVQSADINPGVIFETLNAYQNSAALVAAIELDLFSIVGRGTQTAAAIAQACSADGRAVRILCDFLTIRGFLTKAGGEYANSPTADVFLNRASPAFMGDAARFVHSDDLIAAHRDLTTVVRKGTTQLPQQGTVSDQYEGWVEFARWMGPLMMPAAKFIAAQVAGHKPGAIRVLDIAAGHGFFGIEVAKANTAATIVALDWPAVLEVAKEHAAKAGVAKYETIAGSVFEANLGSGYDVILLTNILHHFNREQCIAILRRVKSALAPRGIIITLEFIPNEDRVSPPAAATFALTMLAATPAGDAYTFADYQSMWQEVGPMKHEMFDVPQSMQRILVTQ